VKGARQVPVAGQIAGGLDAWIAGTSFTALYVPKLALGEHATLAFGATLPLMYMEVGAFLGARSDTDDSYLLGDIMLMPLLVGWRSGTHFASLGLRIFAPSGDYEVRRLANVGMNYWTFTPVFSYTYLEPSIGLDISLSTGIDINTRNDKTDYLSGAMGHLDLAVSLKIVDELRLGVVGGVLHQFADDHGGLADRLNGFRGRSYGVGPLVQYATKIGSADISMTLSWVTEFEAKNRLAGDGIYLNLAGKF
jgi:hypothetical protein